jgi:hypothetical protein
MVALLALLPLRRRNFAALRLDRNVAGINGLWLITLDESETKTHAALEILWPEELVAPLRTFLDVHRPLLSAVNGRGAKPAGDALWSSSHIRRLDETNVKAHGRAEIWIP